MVEPVSSAAEIIAPGISAWSVAKCCSASVSVGAISAAWPPCSTARNMVCNATTVLPDPTSPISSRCIGRSRGEVLVDLVHRVDLVAGRRERQRGRAPLARSATARRPAAPRGCRRAAPGAGAAGRSGRSAARRRPAAGGRPPCPGRSARRPARSPGRAARWRRRSLSGSGSVKSYTLCRCSCTSARIWVELMPLVAGYCAASEPTAATASVLAWALTRKRLRSWYLPDSISRVGGAYCARQPRLVEERGLHDPGAVGDRRLDQRLHPAAAHRARGDRLDLDEHGGDLVDLELRDRARLAGRARQVLEQVADGQQARAPRRRPRRSGS